ncbi:ribonuclease H-like domain-containing protein [Artemisia annua]|uniref:Ribonuclease H-like domain-containing protein n=1 Tax=Artemisia annua TaxID=35608 RepID=A0A2U1QJ89_ARTAN|nr:ribonuclease H-like domain-containing protein [Artemisia annua]
MVTCDSLDVLEKKPKRNRLKGTFICGGVLSGFIAEGSTDTSTSNSEKNIQTTSIHRSVENNDTLGNIIAEGNSNGDGATSEDENYDFEGEDFVNFDMLSKSDEGDPNSVVGEESVTRSSRTSSLPSRLKDFDVEWKVKYDLNRYVDYAYLGSKIYSFVKNLNKTVEPKIYKEAY